ncbi:hypothetical protein A0H81_08511 [Grifola frondosa]|uniref:Uncharacterized protein n=1 Tax=Grifola frondosa TaxID=5627 RepID=A0A1C7M3X5_GRIFR|nr:hypothetical protein A0H81_08511 [Grifola frondosa]
MADTIAGIINQEEALYRQVIGDVFTVNVCTAAAATWVTYDVLLTLGQEIHLIWRAKFSLAKVLYFLVRYYNLFALLIQVAGRNSASNCKRFTSPSLPSYEPIRSLQLPALDMVRSHYPVVDSPGCYLGSIPLWVAVASGITSDINRPSARSGMHIRFIGLTLEVIDLHPTPAVPGFPIPGCIGTANTGGRLSLKIWITVMTVACAFSTTRVIFVVFTFVQPCIFHIAVNFLLILYKFLRGVSFVDHGITSNVQFKDLRKLSPLMFVFVRDAAFYFLVVFAANLLNLLCALYFPQRALEQVGAVWLTAVYSITSSRVCLSLRDFASNDVVGDEDDGLELDNRSTMPDVQFAPGTATEASAGTVLTAPTLAVFNVHDTLLLIVALEMQPIWFPTPVVVLFRRLVNVMSSLSLSHQYLLCRSQGEPERIFCPSESSASTKSWNSFKYLEWPAWMTSSRNSWQFSLEASGKDTSSEASVIDDLPRQDVSPSPPEPPDIIHRLLYSPVLYDPLRAPRYPIALCHGLYGFDVRGPSAFPILQQHYWSNVLNVLRRKVGAEVMVTSVPSTGSIASRAKSLDRYLREKAQGKGINFIAHSMGGLDCRYLITHLKPTEYMPLSLTTIATPHRGSPFMDWCRENIGLGRYGPSQEEQTVALAHSESESMAPPISEQEFADRIKASPMKSTLSFASLPSSFTTLLLSLLDSPAYANLTSTYLTTVFNPSTPNDPAVKYFSVAGRVANMSVWHPLWLPKMVLDGFEERERARLREHGHPAAYAESEWGNDGLVTLQSARPPVRVRARARRREGNGWNLTDWGRFVRAWKREEKAAAKSAGAQVSERRYEEERAANARENDQGDEVVKSSTDKLSAVFDWIVDQVPSRSSSKGDVAPETAKEREKSRKRAQQNDLATKMDLERFYVALCRKLYDEGL